MERCFGREMGPERLVRRVLRKSGDRKYRKRTTEEKIHYLEMVDWKGAKILL